MGDGMLSVLWEHFSWALMFAFVYLVVGLGTLSYLAYVGGLASPIMQTIQAKAFVFATSPFSGLENLSGAYATPFSGLLSNMAVVFVLLALFQAYVTASGRLRVDGSTVRRAFLAGLVASYIVSAIWWYATGYPSVGTSIIGISVAALLLVTVIKDAKSIMQNYSTFEPLMKQRFGAYLPRTLMLVALVMVIVLTVLLMNYLVGNPSYQLHAYGLAATIGLFYTAKGKGSGISRKGAS